MDQNEESEMTAIMPPPPSPPTGMDFIGWLLKIG